ncbi:MAG: hypothetical protein AAF845_20535, partial [Bacteroidota bacterium]
MRLTLLLALVGALVTPADAQVLDASIGAYVWADQPTADSYTPDTDFSYNRGGGSILVTRSSTGRYAVNVEGQTLIAGGGNVQVSAYGSAASCVSNGWGSSGGDLVANVRCDNASGSPVDSEFTLLFVTRAGGGQFVSAEGGASEAAVVIAYAWADDEGAASYTPDASFSYNGAGGAITATRTSVGSYQIAFADLNVEEGHVQATAYRSDARCISDGWGDGVVRVRCYDPAGALVDSRYTVLFVANDAVTRDAGFAWANNATQESYTPDPSYTANPNGAVTAFRLGTGSYQMGFSGLGSATPGGNVMVSAYRTAGVHCNVQSWGPPGGGQNNTFARVRCYDSDGTLTDARYTLLLTWPARVGVTTEAAPEAAFALAVAPNPAASAATVRWQLDAPAEVRLGVYDALG